MIYLPDEAFAAAFAQNASAQELAVLQAVQRPISPACITVAVQRPLWRDRPAWFLTQHFMAARMKVRARSLPLDHTPMVTAPDAVVEIIREAARA
ncbi:hypothetical protein [Mesorhizobium sp.]|uniref:hypothetical protein n=1 Tax=Mesorhizobium sp. TaxID=1871066 RepID=UPI0025BE0BAF|nr:hypothetical protein [Mesorhizobium sp.]